MWFMVHMSRGPVTVYVGVANCVFKKHLYSRNVFRQSIVHVYPYIVYGPYS